MRRSLALLLFGAFLAVLVILYPRRTSEAERAYEAIRAAYDDFLHPD